MNTQKTVLALLVAYLPENGGWPKKVTHIGQDYDRELMFFGRGNVRTGIILDELAIDHRKCGATGVKITREQYEAALAEKEHPLPWDDKNTDADGWIVWSGGECPVDGAAFVDYKMRSGEVSTADAHLLRWNHKGYGGDIIAYRLHQPQTLEEHTHGGVTSGPLTQADFAQAGITEPDDEADLNDCIGQTPEDLEQLTRLLVEDINYSFTEITLADAYKIAANLIDAGYRKQ